MYSKYETPQYQCHVDEDDPIRRLQAEAEREPIQLLEHFGVHFQHFDDLLKPHSDAVGGVGVERLQPVNEFALREAAHFGRVQAPREHQHSEVVRLVSQVIAKALNALRENRVLVLVLVFLEQRVQRVVRQLRLVLFR